MPKFSLVWFLVGVAFAMFILPMLTTLISGKAKGRVRAAA